MDNTKKTSFNLEYYKKGFDKDFKLMVNIL